MTVLSVFDNNIWFGPKYVQINLFWGNTSMRCGDPVGTALLSISSSRLCSSSASSIYLYNTGKLFQDQTFFQENLCIFHCSLLALWKEHELVDTVVFSILKTRREPRLPLGLQGITWCFFWSCGSLSSLSTAPPAPYDIKHFSSCFFCSSYPSWIIKLTAEEKN